MAIQQQRNMTPEELSFFNRPENKPVRNPMDAALAMPVAQGGGMFPQILQGAQQLQQQQLGHGGGRSVKFDAYGRPRDFNAPVGLDWLEANGPGRASVQQRYAAMMPEDINAKAERGRQAVEAMKMLQGQQNDSVGPARWMGDSAGALRTGMKDGQMVGFGTDTPQLAGLHQTPDHLPQRGGQMMTPVQTAIDQAGMAFFGPGEQMQPQQQAPAQAQPQAQAVPARQMVPQHSSPSQAVTGLTPDVPWQNFMPQEQQAQSPLDAVLGLTPAADWTSFMPQGPGQSQSAMPPISQEQQVALDKLFPAQFSSQYNKDGTKTWSQVVPYGQQPMGQLDFMMSDLFPGADQQYLADQFPGYGAENTKLGLPQRTLDVETLRKFMQMFNQPR